MKFVAAPGPRCRRRVGALSADPARMNVPARIHDAEQRRTKNFNDDTWGDPIEWPIRYPRDRNGW
jgi:hypothetical protein